MNLSICIATKNRSEKINKSIFYLLESYKYLLKKKKSLLDTIEICIADSSSDNLTEKCIEDNSNKNLKKIIFLYKKIPPEGIDKGFQEAVSMSSGELVWLLSDDDFLNQNAFIYLERIFSQSTENEDLFILNGSMKDYHNKFVLKNSRLPHYSKSLFNWSELSSEKRLKFFGYMCLISCLIFKKKVWFKGQAKTILNSNKKFFRHIPVLMNGLNSSSKIRIVNRNIILITQGPQSWIDQYSFVYKNAFNECLMAVNNYGREMFIIKNNKDKKPKFSMHFRSFIYGSNYPIFIRKLIAGIMGFVLFYFSKIKRFSLFNLISYEFLSYSNYLLPIIFWRKNYKVILIDSRHSHRLTGIGKFQANLLIYLQKNLKSNPIIIYTQRNNSKLFKFKNDKFLLAVKCSNYIFSEIFQLPLLYLLFKPNCFIITANTAPFFIFRNKSSKVIRIIHDTIFLENIVKLFKSKNFKDFNLRRFFTELYMSVNLLLTSKNKFIENFCISNFSKNSSKVFNISSSKYILPSYFSTYKDKFVLKKNNKNTNFSKLLIFIADDPRKCTIKALEAYIAYIKLNINSGIKILQLIGDIKNKKLKIKLNKLIFSLEELGIKVQKYGYINEEDLLIVLENTDFLLYPSLNEGFGIPICEAWENKVVPIVSGFGALKEFPDDSLIRIQGNEVEDIINSLLKADQLGIKDKKIIFENGKKQLNNIVEKQKKFLNIISENLREKT